MTKSIDRNSLWGLAKLAKERLKNNNYDREIKGNTINNATCFANYIYSQKSHLEEKKPVENKNKSTYDENLYKKVCYIIETKSTQNPILSLIDKDLFDNLDVEAKQFYINNLTQKYKILRMKYYKEHTFAL